MGIFKRKPETETADLLDSLAEDAEHAADELRRNPHAGAMRDAAGLDAEARKLRSRAARARKGGV